MLTQIIEKDFCLHIPYNAKAESLVKNYFRKQN